MQDSYDALPENRLEVSLRRAGQLSDEFKSRQRLSGASGQLSYLIETDNTWDITETIADNPGSPTFELLITFTGDGTQEFPVVLPYIDLRINGTGESNKVGYIPGMFGTLGWKSGSTNVQLIGSLRPDPTYFQNQYVQRWRLLLQHAGTITYYAKVQAMASSDGTIEIERVT